jgi:hypothetical protein
MNVITCGLNSYLGKASLHYLSDVNFHTHGIVRDQNLLISKLKRPTQTQLYNFDIVRYTPHSINLSIPKCELAIYFTQTPQLNDIVGANYELLSIRNFIQFAKNNECNRIIYVGTLYDRKFLSEIERLFIELEVNFTIILKDVAIGEGTSFNDFMDKMLQNRIIFLYKPQKIISFNPIHLQDLMNWIKNVNWASNYSNEYIEYIGSTRMEIEQVMNLYQANLSHKKKHKIIRITNKRIAKICNKYFSGISYDQYAEYINEIIDRSDIANIKSVKSDTIVSSSTVTRF